MRHAKENREKKWAQGILGRGSTRLALGFHTAIQFFPCGLFNVMLEGLSERDTTRSLEVMLTGLNGQLWED